MPRSIKRKAEILDNVRDIIGDNAKGVNYSLTLDFWTSIPERYKRDELRIHLHVKGSFAVFCAIFQYVARGDIEGIIEMFPPTASDRRHSRFCPEDLNQPMLVRVIDLMEPPQGAAPSPFPALVWLQPLDACLMFRAEVVNHVASIPSPLDCLTVGVNGPLELMVHGIAKWESRPTPQENRKLLAGVPCRCFGVQGGELVNETIESGPEIMGHLSDPDSPVGVGWGALNAHAIDIFASLRIELRPDDVILGVLPKGILGVTESLDFTFCTPYLEARTIEWMHTDDSIRAPASQSRTDSNAP